MQGQITFRVDNEAFDWASLKFPVYEIIQSLHLQQITLYISHTKGLLVGPLMSRC
jgi:hypothetical protein